MNKSITTEEGDLKRYRTEIPNIVYHLNLSPYELTLYNHLKRTAGANGISKKSTATLARETKMSAAMISKVKGSLEKPRTQLNGKPLITITEVKNPNGGKPFDHISIIDIWRENFAFFDKTSSPHELASSYSEVTSSPHELRKELREEGTKEERLNYIADATAPPPKASKSQKLSTADPRSRLPPIQLVRTIIGHYPKLLLYDKIIETLGESPDGKKAVACATECAARGWNVENLNTWLFNWYINGIPEKQGNGNGKHQGTNHKTSNIDRIQRNLARCGVEIAPRRSGSNSGSLP